MGKIQHTELNTSDPKAALAFYGSLFDWKFKEVPMPNGAYTLIHTKDGTGIGGLQQHPMPGSPSAWLNYVNVQDAALSAAKAVSLGATMLQPPTDVGIGVFAIFCDPTGAAIAVWQQKETKKEKAKKEKAAKKAVQKEKAATKGAEKAAKKGAEKAAKKGAKEAAKKDKKDKKDKSAPKAAKKGAEKGAKKAAKKAAKKR